MSEQSAMEKIGGSTAVGGLVGFVVGTVNGILGERKPGTNKIVISPKIMSNLATSTVTVAAVGGLYSATTAAMEAGRGKEDVTNHVVGACASGAAIGARYGSVKVGMVACPIFAFSAAVVGLCNGTVHAPKAVVASKHPLHVGKYDEEIGGAH
uniref:NADH dehydrogenase [ubiquinone] 1 alpha subcomplex subunit 11 n=1 Tax=Hanusia phi TaxID=3032 RepID=A0A7S0HJC1_9CRYP